MGLVVIGVQCVSASAGKCYARELVSTAEEFNVPLTWLIGVSSHDPMGNANLYRNEYLHRIPSWHEIGLLLDLNNGVNTADRARSDLIRLGKEILKQCHVKPTACWVTGGQLDETVIRRLEDVGVLVAIAPEAPGAAIPTGLYHPDYKAPNQSGDAKLYRLGAPVFGLADLADGKLPVEACAASSCTVIWTRDDRDDSQALGHVLREARDADLPIRVATAAIRG